MDKAHMIATRDMIRDFFEHGVPVDIESRDYASLFGYASGLLKQTLEDYDRILKEAEPSKTKPRSEHPGYTPAQQCQLNGSHIIGYKDGGPYCKRCGLMLPGHLD